MQLAAAERATGDGSLGWQAKFFVSVYSSYDWPVSHLDDFGIKFQKPAGQQALEFMLKKALIDAGCTDVVISNQLRKAHGGPP